MFVLKNVGKLLFGSNSQESMIELPQGQLYLVRPLSPKGYSELIFKDAAIRIRRTGQDFQYQLVVQRVYEEGEAELLAEEEGEDAEIDALAAERDEKTFLLDEAVHFRIERRARAERVLAWKDLSGDVGDLYEFVCDHSVQSMQVDAFERMAKQCQYERKYRKSYTTASDADLRQFEFDDDEQPIPQASPIHSPVLARSIESADAMLQLRNEADMAAEGDELPAGQEPENSRDVYTPARKSYPNAPPSAPPQPEPREILSHELAELHFYDFPSGSFVMRDTSVSAQVSDLGGWNYWLHVASKDNEWLGIPVVADMNPVFNFEFLSFIFNQFTDDGSAYSWLLRFKDQDVLARFQEGLMQALWEQLNEQKWSKVKDQERQYVLDAFEDLKMDDAPIEEEEEEEEEPEVDEHDDDDRPTSEHYDSDEEDEDVETQPKDDDVNSGLAVGYKHDRSFVVRGSKIGVFKHHPNDRLEFSTNISKVETPKGELFSPRKVMLHNEDRTMILQNEKDPHKLYSMDLEYGKVVDEWNVHDDIPILEFAPENKFAQMTHEPTFLGVSKNALFRVDPRLSGTKLVGSQLKQYASKNDFSALSTTEKGHIAVASNKGDIRLFDRVGINAKTHIPALGEPIIGLDVSADGHWVLATCRTYLLLIDAMQKSGKNEGKLGFEKSFAADSKPQPRRLALTPEHVAQFHHETGKGVSFTPARFNTGQTSEESSIITATGPYIVNWNLKKILRGAKAPYIIKRYVEDVKADDFKFGSDQNVIVALPNEVNMIDKNKLSRPTRESIAGDFHRQGASRYSSGRIRVRQSGRHKLSRDDVVDSPF
ncbi:putative VID27 cytoplasmic protein [Rosellinia necatrix]|uniref:Putative VID27 cytoplasmic protein n=1 Tax=Rosellinia necatrix TaxID=77044 RepID=A0A1W2TR30_ROSNE|nr:putative VID27 cytoplasmic protein [Rosellinia necatrix]